MAHVPEGRGVIAELSVEDNLRLGGLWRGGGGRDGLAGVYELFPRLAERGTQLASTLSGGERQMLVIGRALMSRPRLLLLDEPSLGLAPIVAAQIMRMVRDLRQDTGLTVLLVEQNARPRCRSPIAGSCSASGGSSPTTTPGSLAADDALRHAYLGF